MQSLHATYKGIQFSTAYRKSTLQSFMDWCRLQEPNRLIWLAFMLALHGCILTPMTAILVVLGGNNIICWAFAIAAMAMTLVSNLAAMPTKITIPIFAISLVIDITLIIVSLIILVQG